MKTSSTDHVKEMYEATADAYSVMMDSEIDLPLYTEVLSRLQANLVTTSGVLIDTSCGSGHMLSMYRHQFDSARPLMGLDLSPSMVKIASGRLGGAADILVGDMRDLGMVEDVSAAGVISFFSLHHLPPDDVRQALGEWCRVLAPGGQLLLAAWEGNGSIDYGEASDVVALRYRQSEMSSWVRDAGLDITRSTVEPVEGLEMDGLYIDATKR
jgi:ubiquinone/menaquinone biosynthesis C-methylase UbiE